MNTARLKGPRKTGLVGMFLLWAVCLGASLLAGCRRAVVVERSALQKQSTDPDNPSEKEGGRAEAGTDAPASGAKSGPEDGQHGTDAGVSDAAALPAGTDGGETFREESEAGGHGTGKIQFVRTGGSSMGEVIPIGEEQICVHVSGAVMEPGVYILPLGSRVFQAVEAAGGFAGDADRDWCNQAMALMDADKLVIRTLEETARLREENVAPAGDQFGIIHAGDAAGLDASADRSALKGGAGSGPVNLNTAGADQLTTLPGIGQKRAEDIIAYREMHGGFSSVEELANISGIGSKMLEKIRAGVTI